MRKRCESWLTPEQVLDVAWRALGSVDLAQYLRRVIARGAEVHRWTCYSGNASRPPTVILSRRADSFACATIRSTS